MGTPDFGVPALQHLAKAGFPLVAVITRPDKPKGRGYQEAVSSVKQAALDLKVPLLQPPDVNQPAFLKELRGLGAEVIVVAAFGQILKPDLLQLPPLGCVNLHASLLPKYRGAAPIQWAIARGETETGVTVQKMAEQVDSGDILVQEKISINENETANQLYPRLSHLGGPALVAALEQLAERGLQAGVPQDEQQVTRAPRLAREDGRLDWNWQAEKIHNRVRGFNPWPGTFTEAQGERLKITETVRSKKQVAPDTPPGSILRVDNQTGWLVAAGGGTTICVLNVQCANAKEMSAQSFTCGYRIGVGGVLGLRRE